MTIMNTKYALFATAVSITFAIALGQQVSVNYNHGQSFAQYRTLVLGQQHLRNRRENMPTSPGTAKIAIKSLVFAGALMIGTLTGFARDKYETIDAQAFGTGTQLGQNIGVTLNIYEFSTPADRVVLVQAYEKGQNQGLVTALSENEGRRSRRDHRHAWQRLRLYQNDPNADRPEDRICDESPDSYRRSLDGQSNDVLRSDRWRARYQRSG